MTKLLLQTRITDVLGAEGVLGAEVIAQASLPITPKKPITLALSPWLASDCQRENTETGAAEAA